MPKKEFVKEHKHLLRVLKSNDPKMLHDEFKKQLAEYKSYVGGRAGVSKASGFIQRLMAENKKKHDGSYRNPTWPLHPQSTMNEKWEFKYKKLANADQGGENANDYGASPFITKYFSQLNPLAQKPGETQRQRAQRLRWSARRLLALA